MKIGTRVRLDVKKAKEAGVSQKEIWDDFRYWWSGKVLDICGDVICVEWYGFLRNFHRQYVLEVVS